MWKFICTPMKTYVELVVSYFTHLIGAHTMALEFVNTGTRSRHEELGKLRIPGKNTLTQVPQTVKPCSYQQLVYDTFMAIVVTDL